MQRAITFDPEQSLYLPAAEADCDAARARLQRIHEDHVRVNRICGALVAAQGAFANCMRPTMRPPRFLLEAGHRTTLAQVPEISSILPDILHRDRPINFQAKIDHVASVYCLQALERDRLRISHEAKRILLLEQLEKLHRIRHAASRTSIADLPSDVLDLILDRSPMVAREVCRTFRRLKPMNNLSLFSASRRQLPGPQPRSHRICRIRIQGTCMDFDFSIFGDRPLYLSFDSSVSVPISAHIAGIFTSKVIDFSQWNLTNMQAFSTIHNECLSNMLSDIRPALRYLYIPSLYNRVLHNPNRILVTDRSVIVDATTFDNCLLYGVEFDQPPIVLGASAETQDRYPGAVFSSTKSARSRPIPPGDIADCSEYKNRVAYY